MIITFVVVMAFISRVAVVPGVVVIVTRAVTMTGPAVRARVGRRRVVDVRPVPAVQPRHAGGRRQ